MLLSIRNCINAPVTTFLKFLYLTIRLTTTPRIVQKIPVDTEANHRKTLKGTHPKYYVRTYEYAHWIRNWLTYDLDDFQQIEFFELDEPVFTDTDSDIINMLKKPCRYSYLHYFIDHVLYISFDYESRKCADPDEWNKITTSFLNFEIDKEKYSNDGDEGYEYREEIEKRIKEEVLTLITEEVFSILFYDKEFLFHFNKYLSKKLSEINHHEYPELFKSNGQVKRVSNWPKWLERGIYYRERGRCSYCFKDVSGLLNMENRINLDHIIPLGKGGTNDTSNIQLLCEGCNKEKKEKLVHLKKHLYFKTY